MWVYYMQLRDGNGFWKTINHLTPGTFWRWVDFLQTQTTYTSLRLVVEWSNIDAGGQEAEPDN